MNQTIPIKKVIKALINAKQINDITSLKPKVKKEVKVKIKVKPTITELLTLNNNTITSIETNIKVENNSIQDIINSCHPDIKLLFNHNNIEKYKVNCDYLELKLNTGIKITIYPNKTNNFIQRHIKNGTISTSRHTIHQNRYIIRDNKGKLIVDKKG